MIIWYTCSTFTFPNSLCLGGYCPTLCRMEWSMQGMDKVSQAAEYAEVGCPLVHNNKQHSNIHHSYSNIHQYIATYNIYTTIKAITDHIHSNKVCKHVQHVHYHHCTIQHTHSIIQHTQLQRVIAQQHITHHFHYIHTDLQITHNF